MSDYELLSTVYMVISLVLVAIELGRNLGNQNKKQKVKPPSISQMADGSYSITY